ncbi:MAG: cytochrome c [Hyphomicrobiaceae bacterium]|nr:cytochrome c [Hyphomicrobiaceae bacterium]
MRTLVTVMLLASTMFVGAALADAASQKAAPPPPAPTPAQPQTEDDDGRVPIALTKSERNHMLEGMRTYLEALQGITESLAANKLEGVHENAKRAGAEMLQGAPLSVPLKSPLAFTAMSLNTHEKFDVLAERAEKSASRSEVFTALADIMANCTSCHAAFRVVPAP